MKSCTPMGARVGLTLVELVVVLAILVLVAGTALTATGGLVDETRYESTQSELRNLESALLGNYDSASREENEAISFVADVGRLPRVASVVDGTLALAELWERPADVAPFAILPASGDPEVRLPTGWRGPYMRLGFGTTKLVDGWGRPYALVGADDTAAPLAMELRKIRSLGADAAVGGTGYDADATLVIESTLPDALGARHLGTVPVRVLNAAIVTDVLVRLYAPVNGTIVTFQQELTDSGDDGACVFTNVPIGPRVVRVYRADPTTVGADVQLTGMPRSPIHPVDVVQGGVTEIEFELP